VLRAQSCGDYFFWNKSKFPDPDRQADQIGRRLRRIYDAAGISPRGAHRLRDTFAVEFLNSGGLIEDLAMLLGHSNTNTTWQHYAPWVKSRQIRLDAAVERSLAIQLAQSPVTTETVTVQ
jgi:integrase